MAWPIQPAERALAERVGEDLFRENLVFLPEASRFEAGTPECETCLEIYHRPHYLLLWAFRVKGKPFVDTQVLVVADEKGDLSFEPEGLPPCKETPALCAFPVDEAEALRIAREERFAPGLEPWKAQFYFHSGYKRFVWSVSNVLVRGNDWSESGDILVIDATTGTLLDRGGWFAMS